MSIAVQKQASRMLFIGEPLIERIATREADGTLLNISPVNGYVGDVSVNMPSYTKMAADQLGVACTVDVLTAVGAEGDEVSDAVLAAMQSRGLHIHPGTQRIAGKTLGTVFNLLDPDGTPSKEKVRADRQNSAYRELFQDMNADGLKKLTQGYTDIVISGVTLGCLKQRQKLIDLLHFAVEQNPSVQIIISTNLRPANWRMPDNENPQGLAPQDVSWKVKAIRWFAQLLPLADIIFANMADEQELRGCASAQELDLLFRKLNSKADIVITNDDKPITILMIDEAGGKEHALDVSQPEHVLDTVGAGDSFAGTYVIAIKSGAMPEEAARLGSNVAAQVVGFKGALPAPGTALSLDCEKKKGVA